MKNREISEYMNEQKLLQMFQDTSELAARKQIQNMQNIVNAYKSSNRLTGNVEFWAWMNRNFSGANGHMFSSNEAMNQYLAQGQEKSSWVYKQLQGKGYEWDWIQKQRTNIKNIFKTYSAGDMSNQAAIDVTEHNLLSGKNTDYQMKAYLSKNNPDLHNTGTEIAVVTNAEKKDVVCRDGYTVESFKTRQEIIDDVESRMNDIEEGIATPNYSVKNVCGAMAKSGLVGCAFGIGSEAIYSYKKWKNSELSNDEYLTEILKSGGDAGTSAALTTGIMIPVSATITELGISSIINLPIAFAVTAAVNKIVAPCFGKGEYKKIIGEAHYYQSLESLYYSFMNSIECASNEYEHFAKKYSEQENKYQRIKEKDNAVNQALKDLYDSI